MALALMVARPSGAADGAALVQAAKAQDRAAVRALVAQHVDVNQAAPDGATALHWAAHWNDVAMARLLLRAGARADAGNAYGITPLTLACVNGHAGMVQTLLGAGANPNATRPTGETALMTCARTGNVTAVQALLARGAAVGAREPEQGQTALMWAAAENHGEVVRALVAAGAEVRARTRTATGFTPLLFAAREGAAAAVRALLAVGADVNETAGDGTSALVVATYMGHWELAAALLAAGADPNADAAGYTALHWAVGSWDTFLSKSSDKYQWLAARGPGKLELVQALLARGANPNARLKKVPPATTNSNNDSTFTYTDATPFVLAAKAGDAAVMRALLAAGADPRATTADHTTALMTAAGLGQTLAVTRITHEDALAAVQVALEAMGPGAIHLANDSGETALHAAAYFGVENVVAFLVDHGAPVNARNQLGLTPLTIAEGYGGAAGIVIHETTAQMLRRLGGVGGVEMPPLAIAAMRTPCPQPTIYFPVKNAGNYGNLFVTTTAATRYVHGSCADLQVGTGSVLATEIELVNRAGP